MDLKLKVPEYRYNSYLYSKLKQLNEIGCLWQKNSVAPTYFFKYKDSNFYKYRVFINDLTYSLELVDITTIKSDVTHYAYLISKLKIAKKNGMITIE